MIALKRIVESQGSEGQYYDLGRDFANFRRAIDGSFEHVKATFEKSIGASLVGKRIRARASRGFKQYVKDYEFDVSRITLDDYYDNYVVVAHDENSGKKKEYFLKPGFKIQILGPATGQPSPDKAPNPADMNQQPEAPNTVQPAPQDAPMQPAQVPQPTSHDEPMREDAGEKAYDAYPIEQIIKDIKPWFGTLIKDPRVVAHDGIRDFVTGLGWSTTIGDNVVGLFDLRLPKAMAKFRLDQNILQTILASVNKKIGGGKSQFELKNFKFDDKEEEYQIRLKKTTKSNV
jgi:hypothetical protein